MPETKTPKRQKQDFSEDAIQARTIATRNVFEPEDKRLVEVSNLGLGQTHSLTMLLSYNSLAEKLLEQIKESQVFQLTRYYDHTYNRQGLPEIKEDKAKGITGRKEVKAVDWRNDKELCAQFEAEIAELEDDTFEEDKLFISSLAKYICQVSRGKEGKLLDHAVLLSDTDLQTRDPDATSDFKSSIRSQ